MFSDHVLSRLVSGSIPATRSKQSRPERVGFVLNELKLVDYWTRVAKTSHGLVATGVPYLPGIGSARRIVSTVEFSVDWST